MKSSIGFLVIIVTVTILATYISFSNANHCTSSEDPAKPTSWIDIEDSCLSQISAQIKVELQASITYLTMSSHFSHDHAYRPFLAKFFLNSAIEERSHAKMLIDYYLMRGGELSSNSDLIPTLVPLGINWTSIENALSSALTLEETVTTNIKGIITTCEGTNPAFTSVKNNDYHAVDYLTTMLEEQYTSMREISGLLVTLNRMKPGFGDLAELAFDKELGKSTAAAATTTGA